MHMFINQSGLNACQKNVLGTLPVKLRSGSMGKKKTCTMASLEFISHIGLSTAVYSLKTYFSFINAKHSCNNSTTDHEEIDLAI